MKQLLPPRIFLIILLVGIVLLGGNIFHHVKKPTSTKGEISAPQTVKADFLLDPPVLTLPIKTTEKPIIYARAYIVIDPETKYPILAKNEDSPVPIASTTKIMTSLIAMETLPLDKVVTISSKAATITGSEVNLMTGEKLTVKELLHALLISSANDGAYALAETSGDVDGFVQKMNTKATILGLKNTHYLDPAGLDDTGHSSPRDLAILTSYALTKPLFREIVATPKYTVWSADQRFKHELTNSNRLVVQEEPLYMPQAIGVKTGFTYEAGHCLIAAANINGKEYISVVLHTNEDSKDASAREARKLLLFAGQLH